MMHPPWGRMDESLKQAAGLQRVLGLACCNRAAESAHEFGKRVMSMGCLWRVAFKGCEVTGRVGGMWGGCTFLVERT